MMRNGDNAMNLAKILSEVTFHKMTDSERLGFEGCETEKPLIGEGPDGLLYVIDRELLCVMDGEGSETQYYLNKLF